MKTHYIIPLLLVIGLHHTANLYANHAMAVDLTYACINDTSATYEITLDFYFDCGSTVIDEPLDTPFIQIASASCSALFQTRLSLVEVPTSMGIGREVSQLCDSIIRNQLSNCHMANGFSGVEKYTYKDTLQLPQACTDWVFSYQLEDNETRSQTSSNLDPAELSIARLYVEARLNNVAAPCNSSPTFNAIPVHYFCHQSSTLTQGTVEFDRDSLVYTLVSPLTSSNTPISHRAGFSPQNPFPNNNFIFNTRTGQIDFTPSNAPQFPVVAVLIEEYRKGVLIGSVTRDMQIVILDCVNKSIQMSAEEQTNSTPTPTTDTYFEFCAGDTINFDFILFDGNSEDSLSFETNIAGFPNGATFTTIPSTDPTRNELTGNFFWVPPVSDHGLYVLSLNISDNRCEISSRQSRTYAFRVFGAPYIEADTLFYCVEGGPIAIEVVEGYHFNWSPTTDLSFISPDSSLVLLEPSFPEGENRTYTVTNHCGFRDSVVLKVVEGFTISIDGETQLCAGDSLTPLSIAPSIAGAYDFVWTPADRLYFSNTPFPVTNTSETTTYFVTVTSPFSCSVVDSITVNVSKATEQVTVTADNDLVCSGQSTQLLAHLVQEAKLDCGINDTDCAADRINYMVGNFSTGTVDFTPYNSINSATRIQLLYRAEELKEAGMSSGVLSSIGFNGLNISSNATFEDMTIKMGCTNTTELQSFIPGLSEVLAVPNSFQLLTGWNRHTLTQPYDWDGVSNIVIEFCINRNPTSNNIVLAGIITNRTNFNSFKRVVTNASNQDACSLNNSGSTANIVATERPIIQFGLCVPNDIAPTVLWSPTNSLSDSTILNPIATPISTTTYTVTVTDGVNCGGTADVTITVPEINMMVSPDTAVCDTNQTHTIPLHAVAMGTLSPDIDLDYQWTPTTGLSDPNSPNPVATINNNITYTVLVDYFICDVSAIDSVSITVNTLGVSSITNDTSICVGESVALLATGGNNYNWSPTEGLSNATIPNPIATPTVTTNYQVDISNGSDCIETLAVTINVPAEVSLNIMPNSQNINRGRSILLDATGHFTNIEWTPATGLDDPFSSSPMATIEETITYTATVSTPDGCATQDSITFTAVSCQTILMPTAFSPNGDQMNETFTPLADSYDELLDFRIYSRWGELVFVAKENSVIQTWDGTFNQETQPVGIYVYYVRASCEDKILEKEGWIVLVR